MADIHSLLREDRVFPPPPAFRVQMGVVEEDAGETLIDGFFGNLVLGGDLGNGSVLVKLDQFVVWGQAFFWHKTMII